MCRLVKEINGERKLLDRLPLPAILKTDDPKINDR